jgi:hypothetical protein
MDHAQFDLLVDRHLDGGLDLDGQDRLEALLKADASLRVRYWELARMHGHLTWVARERGVDLPSDEAVDAERALRDSSTSVPHAAKRIRTTPSLWTRAALAAGTAVAAGIAGVALWLQVSAPARMPVSDDATIADLSGATWKGHDGPAVGQAVGNQTLRLESGLAQVRFASGATVILQGPTTFTPRSARGGQLVQGKVSVRVPESAKGFTIDADGVRVIDLGTEFGLATSTVDGDAGQVAVFDGLVQVEATKAAVPFPQTLHHGEATRVTADGQLKNLPIDQTTFVRAMPAELASPLLERGLVAWFRMEETSGTRLADSSGRGHHAEVRGTSVEAISVAGRQGRAVRFLDRTFAEVANHPDFALMQMTLHAWVQPAANQRIDAQIISKQGCYGLAMPQNAAMKFYFWNMDRVIDHPFAESRWVHLCATFDGAIRRFYVDGVRIASINSPTPPKTDDPVRIGALEGLAHDVDRFFQGAIDEVRIYNRALSEDEVRLLYLAPQRADQHIDQNRSATGSTP